MNTTTTCARDKVSNYWWLCLLCYILLIFSERTYISKSWRKLMNSKLENRIPWLFTDFDNIKDFARLFKKFPDFFLTVATLILGELWMPMTIMQSDIGLIYSSSTAQCIDLSFNHLQYIFQGRNPILLLPLHPGVHLTEVFKNRN